MYFPIFCDKYKKKEKRKVKAGKMDHSRMNLLTMENEKWTKHFKRELGR